MVTLRRAWTPRSDVIRFAREQQMRRPTLEVMAVFTMNRERLCGSIWLFGADDARVGLSFKRIRGTKSVEACGLDPDTGWGVEV